MYAFRLDGKRTRLHAAPFADAGGDVHISVGERERRADPDGFAGAGLSSLRLRIRRSAGKLGVIRLHADVCVRHDEEIDLRPADDHGVIFGRHRLFDRVSVNRIGVDHFVERIPGDRMNRHLNRIAPFGTVLRNDVYFVAGRCGCCCG
ncbi:hypothetical protein SDC9_99393 [bioreactor metagenome]|uniref:Uncharacterized protein n=1 Tax=bioreactor metagenome TaxID=1076179 RepID=A0A645AP60_9ZZZZ